MIIVLYPVLLFKIKISADYGDDEQNPSQNQKKIKGSKIHVLINDWNYYFSSVQKEVSTCDINNIYIQKERKKNRFRAFF